MSANLKRIQSLQQEISEYFEKYGYIFITSLTDITTTRQKINYICCCENEKSKPFKEILTRNCRSCINNSLKEVPSDYSVCPNEDEDEKWEAVKGGFISSKGRGINVFGKLLEMDERGRYYFAGKLQYITIIMAIAFKIKDYEKLDGAKCSYIVNNSGSNPPLLENLKVFKRGDVKSESSDKAQKPITPVENTQEVKNLVDYFNKDYKTVTEIGEYMIFEDGNIYQPLKNRFLLFSKTTVGKPYYRLFYESNKSIFVHRLVCFAFHPINGKTKLEDYKGLEVNHKDGNTLNNHKDNLQWTTHSENMIHAYETGLNLKIRAILQYSIQNGNIGDLIAEYISIADASRKTNIPEHEIREIAKNKRSPTNFIWKYKNEEDNEVFSNRYNKHRVREESKESKSSPSKTVKEDIRKVLLSNKKIVEKKEVEKEKVNIIFLESDEEEDLYSCEEKEVIEELPLEPLVNSNIKEHKVTTSHLNEDYDRFINIQGKEYKYKGKRWMEDGQYFVSEYGEVMKGGKNLVNNGYVKLNRRNERIEVVLARNFCPDKNLDLEIPYFESFEDMHYSKLKFKKSMYDILLRKEGITNYLDIEYRYLEEFPGFKIFRNGLIYDPKDRMVTVDNTNNKAMFRPDRKSNRISVDRLVVMAFNPILSLKKYKDYEGVSIIHKDFDIFNNDIDNLEVKY